MLVLSSNKRSADSPRSYSRLTIRSARQQSEQSDQSDGQEAGQGDQGCELPGVFGPHWRRSSNFILISGPGCSGASKTEKIEEN